MSSLIDTLKTWLKSYAKIDDDIQTANKKVYDLRTERREVETNIAKILQSPELSHIEKIQLSEDNSVVKIQRPGWNKPWNISKKELKAMLEAYFNSTPTCTADECFEFIVNSSKERLVSTEFNFTRVKND
jgi:hypothetical protein